MPRLRRPRRYRWAREEIATLDPDRDYERIARLAFEVRFGAPVIAAAFYTVTFARQVAVPSIATILYRNGGGPSMRDVRKRNDDTLVFFGAFFKHGPGSDDGGAFIARLNDIHAQFPIRASDFSYTLDTIIAEGERTSRLVGVEPLSAREQVATFRFWHAVGERMGIEDLPSSYEDAFARASAYERAEWAPTVAGAAVARSVIEDYVGRWLPRRLVPLGFRAVTVLLGRELREIHGFGEPGLVMERVVVAALGGYLRLQRYLPDPPMRSLTESFGEEYGGCPVPADLGYRAASASNAVGGCPVVHD